LKLTKHISQKQLFRLFLFAALLGAAWLFDHSRQDNPVAETAAGIPASDETGVEFAFYCTQQFSPSLRVHAFKIPYDKTCQEKLTRLVAEHLNARRLFLSRAESLTHPGVMLPVRAVRFLIYSFMAGEADLPHSCLRV